MNLFRTQARSQVFLRGGAIQRPDGPNEAERASLQGRGRGALVVAPFERVSVSQLGRSGGMLPLKFLNLSPLKWLEMHLKLTWCGENYILSATKNVAIKNFSPQNA